MFNWVSLKSAFGWGWGFSFGGLPRWLILPGGLHHWAHSITIHTLDQEIDASISGTYLDVRIGPQLLLHKELSFPIAVEKALGEAVDLQMRQALPSSGSGMSWCYAVISKTNTMISVGVWVAKLETLKTIQARIEAGNGILRHMRADVDYPVRDFFENYEHTDAPIRFWHQFNLALIAIFAGMVLWYDVQTDRNFQSAWESEQIKNEALIGQLAELRQLNDAAIGNQESLAQDLSLFETGYRPLAYLHALNQSLDDQSWVSELTMDAEGISLSAFSATDIPTLISAISAQSVFDKVELMGPVEFDSFSRKNRLDLFVTFSEVSE